MSNFFLEKINDEYNKNMQDAEEHWQTEIKELQKVVDQVREQMETDAQMKIESLIQQHRDELSE